MAKTAKLHDP